MDTIAPNPVIITYQLAFELPVKYAEILKYLMSDKAITSSMVHAILGYSKEGIFRLRERMRPYGVTIHSNQKRPTIYWIDDYDKRQVEKLANTYRSSTRASGNGRENPSDRDPVENRGG